LRQTAARGCRPEPERAERPHQLPVGRAARQPGAGGRSAQPADRRGRAGHRRPGGAGPPRGRGPPAALAPGGRSMRKRTFFLTAPVLAVGGASPTGQSLAGVAAKERERQEREKKKAGGPAKVITEDDLRGRGAGTYSQPAATGTTASPAPGASPSSGASPGGEKPKTDEQIRAEQEKAWRDNLQKAQEDVTRISGAIDRLQGDLNDLTGTLYGASRTTLLNRMDQAKKELAAAQQKVADLQEEGRRNRYR